MTARPIPASCCGCHRLLTTFRLRNTAVQPVHAPRFATTATPHHPSSQRPPHDALDLSRNPQGILKTSDPL